jgi:phenylpropionate dioxygenase-like ring-hydroxylating dioxygenase large terminal subunit
MKEDRMRKGTNVSRRDFARTSVAVGAAAVGLGAAVLGTSDGVKASSSAATKGAAVARRRRIALPPEVSYGGLSPDGRDVPLDATFAPAGQAPKTYAGGWSEGTTIPAEYYVEEKHFASDERFIADNFWLMADHENRIPKPGDYFVFEYGRGDSVIVVRDQAGAVKAYHNVCRHRGSRLCLHDMDKVLPSESRPDGKPSDPRLSVVQSGPHGNTPLFRCPYHAWTYDLSGKLVSYPPGLPARFDAAQLGLHPCHVRTVEGFIFLSLARQDPPDFDSFVANWRTVCQEYGTAKLKVVARKAYPTKANWKLALENFRECYHCQHAHTRSFTATHVLFLPSTTESQRRGMEQEMARHGHPVQPRDDYFGLYRQSQPATPRDALAPPAQPAAGGMGMGGGRGTHLPIGFVTASLDGKAVAPLLPSRKEWTHRRASATTGFSTSFISFYDDHVAVARFTPRGVMSTDVEIFWMVNAAARDKEVDIPRMMAVWDITYREDRWIVENNHHGILNSRYNYGGGQPYAESEGGPAGLVKWYMSEVVPTFSTKQTDDR